MPLAKRIACGQEILPAKTRCSLPALPLPFLARAVLRYQSLAAQLWVFDTTPSFIFFSEIHTETATLRMQFSVGLRSGRGPVVKAVAEPGGPTACSQFRKRLGDGSHQRACVPVASRTGAGSARIHASVVAAIALTCFRPGELELMGTDGPAIASAGQALRVMWGSHGLLGMGRIMRAG